MITKNTKIRGKNKTGIGTKGGFTFASRFLASLGMTGGGGDDEVIGAYGRPIGDMIWLAADYTPLGGTHHATFFESIAAGIVCDAAIVDASQNDPDASALTAPRMTLLSRG